MPVNLKENRTEDELIADAVKSAVNADYVVMFGGLNKSSYQDSEEHDRKEYGLPYSQNKLISALAKSNKNFVYVNLSGNAVEMPWSNQVPAIIQGWYCGSEAGTALADIITGIVNPSGKLPFTWPVKLNDVAAHALNTYPGKWRNGDTNGIIDEEYKEGIYVGYRWADKAKIKPLFAFGYGLSYTTFEMSNLRKSSSEMSEDGFIIFTINVKNTGLTAGSETVQLYINDIKSTIDRPYKELKGFVKVHLNPGESKDVSIKINKNALRFWDVTTDGWKSEPGKFVALVGNSSDNLTLRTTFNLTNN